MNGDVKKCSLRAALQEHIEIKFENGVYYAAFFSSEAASLAASRSRSCFFREMIREKSAGFASLPRIEAIVLLAPLR